MMATERRAWSWRQMLLKSSLPGTTRHVLLTLSCHVNDAGEPCYPTVERLSSETGLSKRVVMLHLDKGKLEGWIVVEKHGFAGQKWATNQYRLAWPDEQKGGDAKSPPFPQGGDFNDTKVVTQSNHLQADHIYGFPSTFPTTPISPVGDDAGFERFWQTYPKSRRIAKANCKRIWKRKSLDVQTEQVIRVLLADAMSPQWCKDDGQFIPLPATWLGQDRFERETDAMPPSSKRTCSVCGVSAAFKVGGLDFCQPHFREQRQ